jgi:hypothetical protein
VFFSSCDEELSYPNEQRGEAPSIPEGKIARDFKVKEISAAMILKYNMDPGYYSKYTTAWGIPIVAPNEVDDIYLQNAAELIVNMLSEENLRTEIATEIRNQLFKKMLRVSIYPDNGKLTQQVPEFQMFDAVAGYGATPESPVMTMGIGEVDECEESLHNDDFGRGKRGNTLPHEIMHSIHHLVADKVVPGFTSKLKAAYQNAQNLNIWDANYGYDHTDFKYYINTNYEEYMAEGAEVWFNWQPYTNPKNDSFIKQKDLKNFDPKLYEVLSLIFIPNEDAMEDLTFASPKVILKLDLTSIFGYDHKEISIELFGDNELLRNQESVKFETSFIIPDPRVSYISFENYKFRTIVTYENGKQEIKEYSFTKEELINMEGFPSEIDLQGTWLVIN